jgi:predicted nicotinamide N-methyase
MGMEIYLQFHGVICNALYVSWNYCVAYLNVAKMLTKSRSKGNWGGWWTVLASDVVYNEDVVPELLKTLQGLTGPHTTVLLAGELRNGRDVTKLFLKEDLHICFSRFLACFADSFSAQK